MAIVAAQFEPSFAAALKNELSGKCTVDYNAQRSADRQIDLTHADLKFRVAAFRFKFRKARRQNTVECRSGQSCKDLILIIRRARL